jgi:hypothetical protein
MPIPPAGAADGTHASKGPIELEGGLVRNSPAISLPECQKFRCRAGLHLALKVMITRRFLMQRGRFLGAKTNFLPAGREKREGAGRLIDGSSRGMKGGWRKC